MKNFLFVFALMIFFSCSSKTENASGMDSMNAIDNNAIQDTTIAPFPDGYAPPNAEIDSSQKTKDSAREATQ